MKSLLGFYEADILDTTTGETKRCPMLAGWNDNPERGSLQMWRTKMCDCNLGGYYRRLEIKDDNTGETRYAAHEMSAYQFQPCDHSVPAKRFQAIRAYLSDGRIVNLRSGETTRAAA